VAVPVARERGLGVENHGDKHRPLGGTPSSPRRRADRRGGGSLFADLKILNPSNSRDANLAVPVHRLDPHPLGVLFGLGLDLSEPSTTGGDLTGGAPRETGKGSPPTVEDRLGHQQQRSGERATTSAV
jgi:hypothetical protein